MSEARENANYKGSAGFGSASYWLGEWYKSFIPITKRNWIKPI